MEAWFRAAKKGNETLVVKLLNEDPSLIDAIHHEDGFTALHFACYKNHQLVAAKPSLVNVVNYHDSTALHLAASRGHASIVELLMAVDSTLGLLADLQGATALMNAASSGHLRAAQLLLDACPGALNLVDQCHCNALLYAASNSRHKLVSFLLAANSNVEAVDYWDWNVLHHAIYQGQANFVANILADRPMLARAL